jgi:hypothetical protein
LSHDAFCRHAVSAPLLTQINAGRRRYASDVAMTKHVIPPICSCCGRVAAASDPICIECRRVQHMLVAWGLMRADETGPPESRKLVCRAASAGPRSAAKLLTKDEARRIAARAEPCSAAGRLKT